MIFTPESIHIKRQLDLLQVRRQALRIALQLFESATCQEEIDKISGWFEQSNTSTEEMLIRQAIEELTLLARIKNLSIDL